MSHNCQALVITCMDFRLQTGIRDLMVSSGMKDNYDLVCVGGAAKDLIGDDESAVQMLLRQIKISYELHGVRKVYLIHHTDCGAYGGRSAFDGEDDEFNRQTGDMEMAKKIILEEFSDVEVVKMLARLKEEDKKTLVDFEVIN